MAGQVHSDEARRIDAHAGRSGLLIWALLLLVVSVVFGGASRENPLRLALVELASLPLAGLAIRRMVIGRAWRGRIWPLALLAVAILIPLAQLIPLSPEIWARLPGRSLVRAALDASGAGRPWLPLSLAPQETLGAVLALAPPAAMFLAVVQLTHSEARRMAGVWMALAVAGLGLGIAQLISPQGGAAWLYATTNYGSLVGFFANRNHEAAFLLVLIPFAASFTLAVRPRDFFAHPSAWLSGLFVLLAIVGLGVVRSRAGVLLAAPAIAGSLALILTGPRSAPRWRTLGGLGAVAAAAIGAVALFGLAPLIERFAPQADPYGRFEAWPYVEKAASAYLPLGAGIGAFDRVYRTVEPLKLVTPIYFNHAHNDWMEIWLETGWIGVAALAAFVIWWLAAAWRAWRRRDEGGQLARAASIAVFLLLAHSLVDYPLRTTTLSVFFAFCCALLAAPAAGAKPAAAPR
jgi:hypothetical protein